MKTEKQRELIQKELNSEYPKWSLIIDYATEAREIDYPGDTSHLLELSGLGNLQDVSYEYQPPKIEEDDDFWNR
jgi:hypothetical protein